MKKFSVFAALVSLVIASHGEARASEEIIVQRHAAERFVTLPDGVRFPEGITANPKTEEIYVATFDLGPNSNKLLRFNKQGQLVAERDFGGTPLLGLQFSHWDNKVYICNFGASKIQRIAAKFDGLTEIEDVASIPAIGPPPDPRKVDNPDMMSQDTIIFGSNGFPAPNALTFDRHGNLYVSDSFQGAIFRIDHAHKCVTPCEVTKIKHDGLLATAGFPPFGANGLALTRDGNKLFIANTGDDRILRLDLETENKDIVVWAESINGADGIALHRGRLFVAANQADEVLILNENGRVIAKLGDFLGIRRDGSAHGLLFPASLVIVDDKIFVTNLALPLTTTEGDEPEEDVTKYTISRIDIPEHLP
jgi:hypothetical protein